MRFVTIKDIARALGLSVSTVSRTLNDDNNIRQETRQKVLATAKQMGYMKSPVAMNLKFGYTKTIGVIVPEMTTPYASLVIDGIQNVCYANHYKVVIASSGEDAEKERQSIEIMYQFMVDGIIACRTDNRQNHDLYQSILDRKMPLVLYDRLSPDLDAPHVGIDDETKAFFLIDHLIRKGRKRIAFIGIDPNIVFNAQKRYNGYRMALERHHITPDPDLVVWANGMSYSDGGVAIDRLLGKSIDAVFAFTDTLAIGAMNRLTSMGRRVPEDIAVAGFSGTIISSIVNPQLTTVEPPQYAIGQAAARLVLDLINGKQPEKKEVTLDAEIIYRKSTE
ncbi:MAG: LacI family DNA-binding transcriptional regulator [Prevotella sp.]|nr:LacI family DNA-binding transcriptional regulator [Prevotella sp.]